MATTSENVGAGSIDKSRSFLTEGNGPTVPSPRFDVQEFHKLVQRWREETGMLSSISAKIKHPAYRAIVGMGAEAIPWLLVELRDRPSYWISALTELSEHHANPPTKSGDFGTVRDAWLAWGKERGFID